MDYIKDTDRKIRTTFSIEYCGMILVPNCKAVTHNAFVETLTSFHLWLRYWIQVWKEPIKLPQMYMSSVFLIFLLVSLDYMALIGCCSCSQGNRIFQWGKCEYFYETKSKTNAEVFQGNWICMPNTNGMLNTTGAPNFQFLLCMGISIIL